MFYTNKWLLTEVIAKCFSFDEEEEELTFRPDFLTLYLVKAQNAIKGIEKVNLGQQFRFSILQRSIQVIAQTKIKVKQQEFLELLNTVNDEDLFEAWYRVNVEPAMSASKRSYSPPEDSCLRKGNGLDDINSLKNFQFRISSAPLRILVFCYN